MRHLTGGIQHVFRGLNVSSNKEIGQNRHFPNSLSGHTLYQIHFTRPERRIKIKMKLNLSNSESLTLSSTTDIGKTKTTAKKDPSKTTAVNDQKQFDTLMKQPFDQDELAYRARSASQIAGFLAGFNDELSGQNGLGTWQSESFARAFGPVEIVAAELTQREYGGDPAGEDVGHGVKFDSSLFEGGVYYDGNDFSLELGAGLSLNDIISAAALAAGIPGVGVVLSSLDATGILSAEVGGEVTVDVGKAKNGLMYVRINTGTNLDVTSMGTDGEVSGGRSYQILLDGKGDLGISSNLPDRL